MKLISIFNPNTGKYGPGKTSYFDTFQAVSVNNNLCRELVLSLELPIKFVERLKSYFEIFHAVSVNNNLCIKLVLLLELPIKFDERLKSYFSFVWTY